jgi:hypothetical protein
VIYFDRFGDSRLPVQVSQVAPEVRVVHDAPEVALEVAVVDGVEAHERREEAPVGLCDAIPTKVAVLSEHVLPVVTGVEELRDGLLVDFLLGGEARVVDAIPSSRRHYL